MEDKAVEDQEEESLRIEGRHVSPAEGVENQYDVL